MYGNTMLLKNWDFKRSLFYQTNPMAIPSSAELQAKPELLLLLKRASRVQLEMNDYEFSQWYDPEFLALKEHFHRLLDEARGLLIALGNDSKESKMAVIRLMNNCHPGISKAQERAWMTIEEAIGTDEGNEPTSLEEFRRERNMYKLRSESLQKQVDSLTIQLAAKGTLITTNE